MLSPHRTRPTAHILQTLAAAAFKHVHLACSYTFKELVRKRSTELLVGPGLDMEQRANILVTEVFDTELIGEGAIGTYNHAATHLLTEDRVVVPGLELQC